MHIHTLRAGRGIVLILLATLALATNARAAGFAPVDACVGNERLIISAVERYVADHAGTMPPMTSVSAFDAALSTYVPGPSTFICPETGDAYVPNPIYDGVSVSTIADFSAADLFEDATAHSDGLKTVAYYDGFVTRGGAVQGDTNLLCVSNMRQVGVGIIR